MPLWGAIQEMKHSLEQNRALAKRKDPLRKHIENKGHKLEYIEKELSFKEVSEEDLESIKAGKPSDLVSFLLSKPSHGMACMALSPGCPKQLAVPPGVRRRTNSVGDWVEGIDWIEWAEPSFCRHISTESVQSTPSTQSNQSNPFPTGWPAPIDPLSFGPRRPGLRLRRLRL